MITGLLAMTLVGAAWSGDALRQTGTRTVETPAGPDLPLRRIAVSGQRHSDAERLNGILDALRDRSITNIDLTAARAAIMAMPWIDDVRLQLQLPDRLQVTLREREAYAIWQRDGRRYLVDRTGHVLMSGPPRHWFGLPLVVGAGAAEAAAGLLDAMQNMPVLKARLRSATYVAHRRWTLHLDTGVDVELPENGWPDADYGLSAALERLSDLEYRYRIGERSISRIDLRFADRIVLRRLPGTVIADTALEHST